MVLLMEICRNLFTGNKGFFTNMIEREDISFHDRELDTEYILKTVAPSTEYCKSPASNRWCLPITLLLLASLGFWSQMFFAVTEDTLLAARSCSPFPLSLSAALLWLQVQRGHWWVSGPELATCLSHRNQLHGPAHHSNHSLSKSVYIKLLRNPHWGIFHSLNVIFLLIAFICRNISI